MSSKLLAVLALCSFFVGLDSIITVPLLPEMTQSANMPEKLGALLVTAYALVYMLSAPLFGALSDRWGRKRLILCGMLVLGVGTLLTGWASSFPALLAFRALTGLGAGMIEPTVFALIGDRVPYEQRGRATGIVMGALIGSTLFGVPLGTYFAQFGSWRWTFWGIGILAFVVLLVISWGIPQDRPQKSAAGAASGLLGRSFRAALSSRSVFFALLSTFLWFGALQGMFSNIGTYYHLTFQLDVRQIGLILMLAGFGSVLGNVIGGRMADKLGKKVVIGLASIACAFGVLGISLIEASIATAIMVHVAWATAFGFGQAALTALASELHPEVRGTVMSLNSSAMYAGMVVASAASAPLLQQIGFAPIGVMCALASLLVWPISRAIREQHPVSVSQR
ncbi:MFS transporter [Brevibacillus humidisoli]|uniref:MFS transporter n=1 Tax=Brevibacillus humidisoli TaxID=2895522 RepID=UPI001E59754D|nr:MFS transporter [Brevibacillus humidisoli]UFJ40822.1 MFS transporter [Brevibacillus humidisoli]